MALPSRDSRALASARSFLTRRDGAGVTPTRLWLLPGGKAGHPRQDLHRT
jgi:hypothetical protein